MHNNSKTNRFLIIVMFCCFVGFNATSQNKEELVAVVSKLKQDNKHNFLKTLKPSQSDFSVIFINEAFAQKAYDYSNEKWVGIDHVSDDSMKPKNNTDDLRILSVTKKELSQGITNGLPADYTTLSNYIKDDVVVYALEYLNSDGSSQKKRAAFFKVKDKWIIIPQVFKAF